MIFLGGPWRCIIIMAMIFAAGGTFLVENPANSLIALHPRWVWFLECLRKYHVFVPRRSKHCVFFSLQNRAWNMFMMKTCFEQVINLLLLPLYWAYPKVWKVAFWMRKFGALSWKRTWLWSNSRSIGALDKGRLTRQERNTARPTTTRYRDKSGKLKFKGNGNLKKSQKL